MKFYLDASQLQSLEGTVLLSTLRTALQPLRLRLMDLNIVAADWLGRQVLLAIRRLSHNLQYELYKLYMEAVEARNVKPSYRVREAFNDWLTDWTLVQIEDEIPAVLEMHSTHEARARELEAIWQEYGHLLPAAFANAVASFPWPYSPETMEILREYDGSFDRWVRIHCHAIAANLDSDRVILLERAGVLDSVIKRKLDAGGFTALDYKAIILANNFQGVKEQRYNAIVIRLYEEVDDTLAAIVAKDNFHVLRSAGFDTNELHSYRHQAAAIAA